ncbi:MAG: SpoIIE family protein phosphatase, partial [Actinomycetota bacterium]
PDESLAVASARTGWPYFGPVSSGRSVAGLPLSVGERVLGVLAAVFDDPAPLDEDARRTLLTLADMVAQALERTRLLQRESSRRRRAELLDRVGGELLTVEGSEERIRLLADMVVPDLADFAWVERATPDGGCEVLAVRHRDRSLEEPLRLLRERRGPAAAEVVPPERTALVADVADDALGALAGDAEGEALLRAVGPTSLLSTPIRSADRVVAVLVLGTGPGQRRFGEEDRDVAVELAARAGVAVERAGLFEREHAIAQELQRSLLGPPPASGDDVLVAARYRPGVSGMEIGGDWHDVIRLPDGCVGAAVGDVVGRGLHAAAAMGRLRSALAALASVSDGPAQLLDRLEWFAEGLEGARLATVAYAVIDPVDGRVRYSCAGHPPPLVVSPDGTARFLWDGRSGPIGAFAARRGREAAEALPPGASLLLYSDGLFERRGEPVDAGLERLRTVAARCVAPDVERMADDVVAEMLAGRAQTDDVVLLVIRLTATREPAFTRRFPARPEELAPLRRAVRAWLAQVGVDGGAAQDLILAMGEAAANAVEHAYPRGRGDVEVRMRLAADGGVSVVVADQGEWRDPPAPGVRGRGTALIRALMDDVAIERRGGGTEVRMRHAPSRVGAAR